MALITTFWDALRMASENKRGGLIKGWNVSYDFKGIRYRLDLVGGTTVELAWGACDKFGKSISNQMRSFNLRWQKGGWYYHEDEGVWWIDQKEEKEMTLITTFWDALRMAAEDEEGTILEPIETTRLARKYVMRDKKLIVYPPNESIGMFISINECLNTKWRVSSVELKSGIAAMEALRQGQRIKRKHWGRWSSAPCFVWFTVEDIMANDWQIGEV